MKTKLEAGKEYWLDAAKDESGIFVGIDGNNLLFKPSSNCVLYVLDGGYIKLLDDGRLYSEYIPEKPWQFTTPIAMKCTEEQFNGIKDKLVEMGYNTEGIWYLDTCDYLCTNFGGNDKDVDFSSTNIFQPNLFDEFNPDLFLALAAMTDKEDGINGEWWKCIDTKDSALGCLYIQTKSDFSEMVRVDKNKLVGTGFDCATLSEFRKATAQEIIEHFKEKKFVLPARWRLKVDSNNEQCVNNWRNLVIKKSGECPNDYIGEEGLGCGSDWGSEITFAQFKKYVLKETAQSCQIIPIPPTKQATLFDDRVEITDWKPTKDDEVFEVCLNQDGGFGVTDILPSAKWVYKKKKLMFVCPPFMNKIFVKRTEKEAIELVSKLNNL